MIEKLFPQLDFVLHDFELLYPDKHHFKSKKCPFVKNQIDALISGMCLGQLMNDPTFMSFMYIKAIPSSS